MSVSIVVVIPAYNEETRIGGTLRAIAAYGDATRRPMRVVVADDGSVDRTIEVARSSASCLDIDLTVLSLPHAGKGSAVRSGMLFAAESTDAEYALMLDADNEIAVDQLSGVDWAADPSTIYIGRRVEGVDTRAGVRPPPLRRLMSAGMRGMSRLLLGLPFPDTQCGFKLFPRHLVADLFGHQHSRGWVFDAEILAIAVRSGHPVVEVPVVWRPQGVSRVKPRAAVTSVVDMLLIAARMHVQRREVTLDHAEPRRIDLRS